MNNTHTSHDPEKEYEKRRGLHSSLMKKYAKKANIISNLRLLVFAAGAAGTVFLYLSQYRDLSIFAFLLSLFIFIYLVISHEELIRNEKYSSALYSINEKSLNRLNGNWKNSLDTGEEFKDKKHPYSEDLDIFGKGSLFQLINTCSTFTGKNILKDTLTKRDKTIEKIHSVQESVVELSEKVDWRQGFQAEGTIHKEASDNPEFLFEWADETCSFFRKPLVIFISRLLPTLTITSTILYVSVLSVPLYIPLSLLFCQMIFLSLQFKEANRRLRVVDKYKDSLKAYDRMIAVILKEQFDSKYIKELKGKLYSDQGKDAHKQIESLVRIVSDMVSMRRHQLYIVFDILTLWDYQCEIALEKWKARSGRFLRDWLLTIGEIEMLSSLSVIKYDHPDWVMPDVTCDFPVIKAKDMGHPLLHDSIRICNNLDIGRDRILLITGSNMSGKSTFLRTTGINLVLAYCGAPVCAKHLRCSIMDIYTSMRISDNLEESISSFYAELLRIKLVVEASKANQRIFFLLDEIFKGTNSIDRHTGAKALIKKLLSKGTVGLVSTHDLELGDMEEDLTGIKNYHFQEYYLNGDIHFDYRLRLGVSNTRNAMYLMKIAGIEMDGSDD